MKTIRKLAMVAVLVLAATITTMAETMPYDGAITELSSMPSVKVAEVIAIPDGTEGGSWAIYVWQSHGSANGQPGYVYSQLVHGSIFGGWQGYSATGNIIESHFNYTGIPSGPGTGAGACSPAFVYPCHDENRPAIEPEPNRGRGQWTINPPPPPEPLPTPIGCCPPPRPEDGPLSMRVPVTPRNDYYGSANQNLVAENYWRNVDPMQALAWIQSDAVKAEQKQDLQIRVVRYWVAKNPMAAMNYARTRSVDAPADANTAGLVAAVANQIADTNCALAMSYVESLQPNEIRLVAAVAVAMRCQGEGVWDWVNNLPMVLR